MDNGSKDIPIHKCRELVFGKDGDQLVTTEGTLRGKIKWEDVKATSDVGMLTLWREHVTKIEIFLAKTPDGKHPEDKAEEPKRGEDEPVDMGIRDPEHDSTCYLGGGKLILDFEQNFRMTESHGGYFFDLKPTNHEGYADGFSVCRACQGSAWSPLPYRHHDPYEEDGGFKEDDPCPHCGGKGSIGIYKNTMRLCTNCGRTH
jgi:hypothetical protein